MSTFVPKDPETLVSFESVLAEYNEITGINTIDDLLTYLQILNRRGVPWQKTIKVNVYLFTRYF